MKIEIAEPGRMTQSGHSLLKLIQNNDLPKLDLFVRESVQNSLDASNGTSDFVTVEMLYGTFKTRSLNMELEGITDSLNRRYPEKEAEFLAVRDFNTTGLTGPLSTKDVRDNNYGNLIKLVYEISKEQETSGAGGSWGLGKTVYFQIGMGLVLYYSRIRLEDGKFQSRLAACLVENERAKDALIPANGRKIKRGIAWWGQKTGFGSSETMPVTSIREIEGVLKIFNIPPYSGQETGTTIIIPYIDSQALLTSHLITEENESPQMQPWWNGSVEDYLRMAIQRWYTPRLDNPFYKDASKRSYLNAVVNGKKISRNDLEPVFSVLQALYNRSIGADDHADWISRNRQKAETSDINIRNELDKQKAGTFSYIRLNRKDLGMNNPDNNPAPEYYLGLPYEKSEDNRPIISYTRGPGMLVSYETSGSWAGKVPSTSSDEYILGIYTLNSDNLLKNSGTTLEEYVRQGELADHKAWHDHVVNKKQGQIVSKIQKRINSLVKNSIQEQEAASSGSLNKTLGARLAEILLPPDGFGHGAGMEEDDGNGGSGNGTRKEKNRSGLSLEIKDKEILFGPDGMTVYASLKADKGVRRAGFLIEIASDNGNISVQKWKETVGLQIPFNLTGIQIVNAKIDKNLANQDRNLNLAADSCELCGLTFTPVKCSESETYGLLISSEETHTFDLRLKLNLALSRTDVQTVFRLEK